MKYKLVSPTSDLSIETQINKYLSQGWELYGNLIFAHNLLWQPMTKKNEEEIKREKEAMSDER